MAARAKAAARKGGGETALFDRQPPQSYEAERAVLGAMLLNPDAVGTAIEVLRDSAEDIFYVDAHQRIYEAMIELYRATTPIDTTTLLERLIRNGNLDEAGGATAIAELTGAVPTSANIEYYAKIVLESALLRKIITTCARIEHEAYEAHEGVDKLLDRAEAEIFTIAQKRQLNPIHAVGNLLQDGIKRIQDQMQTAGGVTGVPSGLVKLDEMLSGFQPSDMIVLAARPSVGKTAFCLNIAAHAATKHNKGVLIFSLEMAKEQLVQRLLCMVGQVDSDRLRRGFLARAEFPKLQKAAGILSNAKIYIDETSNIGIMELRSKARRHKIQHPVDMIVIDYLQLMSGTSRSESRQVEISEISRSIKGLARELSVPVVALSQLSREAEKDDSGTPKLSHLRESGAIEQDADVVLMLARPPSHEAEGRDNVIKVSVAKQRNGPTGNFEVLFDKHIQRFRNLTEHGGQEDAPPPAPSFREDFDVEEPLDDEDVPF